MDKKLTIEHRHATGSANDPQTDQVDRVPAAVVDSLLRRQSEEGPRRSREQSSPQSVRIIAERLFERADPTAPSSWPKLVTREARHFYAQGILRPDGTQPLDWQLANVFTNGSRLFLQGAALGVGASTLTADYVRSFNMHARAMGDPRRAAYVRLHRGTDSIPKFFDTLALANRAPLTSTEVRFHGPAYFAWRVLAAAQQLGVSVVILDHIHRMPVQLRAAIADLLEVTDPNYRPPFEIDECEPAVPRRLGVILVDHLPPELLFRQAPEVLLLLEGHHAILRPYQRLEDIGEALRQADIGLEDWHPDDPGDAAMATAIGKATSGLVASLQPLLEMVDLIARTRGVRPSPEIVAAAVPFHRKMVRLIARRANVPGGRTYHTVPRQIVPRSREDGDDTDKPIAAANTRAPQRRRKPSSLRDKREARELATAEGRAMRRHKHVNLPSQD